MSSSNMKIEQHIPSLQAIVVGELDQDTDLALFRGIPYASVEKRWTHSIPRHSLDAHFDATQFGPRCPQGNGEVLVSGGITDPAPGDDEFKCLNLNVTVPTDALPRESSGHAKKLLPVMVWIHGGAFNYGAISVARYRTQALTSFARAQGTPIVLVQIGYRLGPFGFAASNDIASESTPGLVNGHIQNGDHAAPLLGNYGLIDQRNGLEWVRQHISDFGGDPSNVTAFGVSAGSASIHYHILTGDPLFDRAILMSGSAPTLGPLHFDLYQNAWDKLCQNCGINDDSASSRLSKLRDLPPSDLIENYTKAAMGPMGDSKLLPSSWKFGSRQTPTRCKSIILGDTRVEAIIFDGLIKRMSQSRLHSLIRSAFANESDAQDFAQNFGFTLPPPSPSKLQSEADLSAPQSPESYLHAFRHFLSAALFQYPNHVIASTFAPDPSSTLSPSSPSASSSFFSSSSSSTATSSTPSNSPPPEEPRAAYLYHFEEPSPYPGPTLTHPYHGQCALFLYQNENAVIPACCKRTAENMARAWAGFAWGKEPWQAFTPAEEEGTKGEMSGQFMRFGPEGEEKLMGYEEDGCRGYEWMEWVGQHWEEVKRLTWSVVHVV